MDKSSEKVLCPWRSRCTHFAAGRSCQWSWCDTYEEADSSFEETDNNSNPRDRSMDPSSTWPLSGVTSNLGLAFRHRVDFANVCRPVLCRTARSLSRYIHIMHAPEVVIQLQNDLGRYRRLKDLLDFTCMIADKFWKDAKVKLTLFQNIGYLGRYLARTTYVVISLLPPYVTMFKVYSQVTLLWKNEELARRGQCQLSVQMNDWDIRTTTFLGLTCLWVSFLAKKKRKW